jgi:threonine/homoserine/homoserine lactone efflux protein
MDAQHWALWTAAAIGLSVTPGPNSLLVITHGALHGLRRTGWTVAGGALGFAVLIAASGAGIGALLAASVHALLVLKIVGGLYLVWLGVQLWRAPPVNFSAAPAPSGAAVAGGLFRQGLLTALSNPKALLFYGAFLPQMIDPKLDFATQMVAIAAVFVLVEIAVEFGLAATAHRVRPWLERAGRRFNRTCGALFVAMGVALPATR